MGKSTTYCNNSSTNNYAASTSTPLSIVVLLNGFLMWGLMILVKANCEYNDCTCQPHTILQNTHKFTFANLLSASIEKPHN